MYTQEESGRTEEEGLGREGAVLAVAERKEGWRSRDNQRGGVVDKRSRWSLVVV